MSAIVSLIIGFAWGFIAGVVFEATARRDSG